MLQLHTNKTQFSINSTEVQYNCLLHYSISNLMQNTCFELCVVEQYLSLADYLGKIYWDIINTFPTLLTHFLSLNDFLNEGLRFSN